MVLDEEVKKLLQQAVFDISPNKVVLNGVLAWLDAVDDSLGRDELIRIMNRCYSDYEVMQRRY
jgi:hypothetical protein